MNLRKLFNKEKKKKFSDMYQSALNKSGKEQFAKMLQKGLEIPIVLL